MIGYLEHYFDPETVAIERRADGAETEYSLAIAAGRRGARLSHSHRQQFHYVRQTLLLWRNVLHDMYRLWHLAGTTLLWLSSHHSFTSCLLVHRKRPA